MPWLNLDDTALESGRTESQACSLDRMGEQQHLQTPRVRSGTAVRMECGQRQHLALMQDQLMGPRWLRSRQRRIVMVCLESMRMAAQMQRKGHQHAWGKTQMVES